MSSLPHLKPFFESVFPQECGLLELNLMAITWGQVTLISRGAEAAVWGLVSHAGPTGGLHPFPYPHQIPLFPSLPLHILVLL